MTSAEFFCFDAPCRIRKPQPVCGLFLTWNRQCEISGKEEAEQLVNAVDTVSCRPASLIWVRATGKIWWWDLIPILNEGKHTAREDETKVVVAMQSSGGREEAGILLRGNVNLEKWLLSVIDIKWRKKYGRSRWDEGCGGEAVVGRKSGDVMTSLSATDYLVVT